MASDPAMNAALRLRTKAERAKQAQWERVRTVGLLLKEEIQKQLSTPGQGRWYAKSRQSGSDNPAAAMRRRRFNRRLGQLAFHLNAGAPLDVVKPTELRNLHRASAPGAPPAPDTGDLRRSTFMEESGNRILVGVQMAYARFLEFGTEHMQPRPFMRPAWALVQRMTRGKQP